jgi:hypothetical protein
VSGALALRTDVIHLPRIAAMARRALPHVVEGVILPAAVFYTALLASGSVWAGITAAVAWSYVGIARRAVGKRRVSGLLLLTAVTLSIRFAVSVALGSTFSYFLQPAIGQLAVAGAFVASLRWEEPILLRLAGDVVPPETLAGRPCVLHFFRQITVFWAAVLVVHAAVGLWLLVTLNVEVYVVTKTVVDGAVKVGAILASIWWFRRVMRMRGVAVSYG